MPLVVWKSQAPRSDSWAAASRQTLACPRSSCIGKAMLTGGMDVIPNDMNGANQYECRVKVLHQALRFSTSTVVAEMKHIRTSVFRSTEEPTYSAVPTATTLSMEVGSTGKL